VRRSEIPQSLHRGEEVDVVVLQRLPKDKLRFLLGADYRPGKNILQIDRTITFYPGDMQTFPLDLR
jgi:hypothetical protein